MTRRRKHAQDLRAVGKLVVDATTRVADVVHQMHGAIGGPPARILSAPVFAAIKGIAKVAGVGVDQLFARLEPLLGDSEPGPEREAARAALNGVVGDYLAATQNPLAIAMHLRAEGPPRPRLVVLVHGSSMNDRQWSRNGHDHGAALARDLEASAIYVHYNSGLHVSDNGRALATQLDSLVASWPVAVESITLVGHSMGGLVARSACHYAAQDRCAWLAKLTALVCLGTPHHGAGLERIGNWVQRVGGISRYSAPIAAMARLRSAGVTDLRFGYVIDEHWQGRDRFDKHTDDRSDLPLPANVACFALAGSLGKGAGDGLVSIDSALGRRKPPAPPLFPAEHQAIAPSTGHLDLLSEAVYPILRGWLCAT